MTISLAPQLSKGIMPTPAPTPSIKYTALLSSRPPGKRRGFDNGCDQDCDGQGCARGHDGKPYRPCMHCHQHDHHSIVVDRSLAVAHSASTDTASSHQIIF